MRTGWSERGAPAKKGVRGLEVQEVGALVFDIAYLGVGWPGGHSMRIDGTNSSVRGWLISSRVNQ